MGASRRSFPRRWVHPRLPGVPSPRAARGLRARCRQERVWTFCFYQHVLDFARYELALGSGHTFSLPYYLDGQPLQIMAKTTDGRYLWNFEIWHEQLLEGALQVSRR